MERRIFWSWWVSTADGAVQFHGTMGSQNRFFSRRSSGLGWEWYSFQFLIGPAFYRNTFKRPGRHCERPRKMDSDWRVDVGLVLQSPHAAFSWPTKRTLNSAKKLPNTSPILWRQWVVWFQFRGKVPIKMSHTRRVVATTAAEGGGKGLFWKWRLINLCTLCFSFSLGMVEKDIQFFTGIFFVVFNGARKNMRK